MTRNDLFRGPASLRVPRERASLVWTLAALAFVIPVAGFLSDLISWHSLAIVAVVGMVFVTLSRGRLLGTSVRVHPDQFPETFAIVERCAAMLAMRVPQIFVRDDDSVPIAAVGIGEPYSLVISTRWLHELKPDELAFIVGRELGHIAAGHTRYTSLLSINGKENPVISVAFGAWLRKLEYTADRIGMLCCGSIDAAHRAIAIATFHKVGRSVDLFQFIEQRNDLQREPTLRMGEWLTATPYAVHRITELDAFNVTPMYAFWRDAIATGLESAHAASASDRFPDGAQEDALRRNGYAGFWRRCTAWCIDSALLGAIVSQVIEAVKKTNIVTMTASGKHDPDLAAVTKWVDHANAAVDLLPLLLILVYVVVFVGLIGQTFGMLVMDLRVVDVRFQRIGLLRAFARYACFLASLVAVYPIFRIFGRIQPYEKWSGTRLVQTRALEERGVLADA